VSNFQPSLVVDENLATGWARIEVYGDERIGKLHMARGRALLGQLKCDTGANQQAVDNREMTGGDGFSHRWKQLSDGTRLHAMSNDGHDTIRIYAPGSEEKKEKKIDRKNDFDAGAYLWVGARFKDGVRHPWYGLDFYLLEPQADTGRGMVNSIFSAVGGWSVGIEGDFSGANGAFVLSASGRDGNNADELSKAMYTTWYQPNNQPASHFSYTMVPGDHSFECFVDVESRDLTTNTYNAATNVSFTRNGLFLMGFDDSSHLWGPHDPSMSAEENAGSKRDFSSSIDTNGSSTAYHFGWDYVAWIDPFAHRREVSHRTADKRANTLAFQRFLRENKYTSSGKAQILDGTYYLVVRAYDSPPGFRSSRTGQAIPISPSFSRSASCDYAEYMQSTNAWPPLEVEVEVRIGRANGTNRIGFPLVDENADFARDEFDVPGATFKFNLVCSQYDERFAVTYPHGSNRDYDDCAKDNGPNMGGPSFSEVIAIDVKGKRAEIAGGVSAMNPFLGEGAFHAAADQQRREVVFFIGTAFPVPDAASWPTLAGTALFTAAENVTSGSYGCADMTGEITEAEAQAMFVGTDQTHVWAWFPAAGHTLVDFGPPQGSPSDWAYHDPPFDSTNFYWYYTVGVSYAEACKRPYGIAVTSVGGFYEMTTNWVGATGFTNPDCCTS
jgi:hypothetical protein